MVGLPGKSHAALIWGCLVQVAFNAFAELYPREKPAIVVSSLHLTNNTINQRDGMGWRNTASCHSEYLGVELLGIFIAVKHLCWR